MGIKWAATLIAGILFLLAVFPFIFYKYGPRIRSGSRFAPCVVSPGVPIIHGWSAHVGAGSRDRKGVGRREKIRDGRGQGRGIDNTNGLMAGDMALFDTILEQRALSGSSELQCAWYLFLSM